MRAGRMRDRLRLHGLMAGLAAELDRVHGLDAFEGGERHDEQVDGRQYRHCQDHSARSWTVQIESRPFAHGGCQTAEAATALEPCAQWHEQQADHEQHRQSDEEDDAEVWIRMADPAQGLEDEKGQEENGGGSRQRSAEDRYHIPQQTNWLIDRRRHASPPPG
jgi:hypothetical protein